MKKYLYMLLVAAVLCGCSKDDDNGSYDGKFRLEGLYFDSTTRTTLTRVDLEIVCDAVSTLTFTPEGDAQGIVSPNGEVAFDMDYIYAGEPIDVKFSNGVATATFWYIPLTDGRHTVSFTANFTRNGVSDATIFRSTLSVNEGANLGFSPVAVDSYGHRYLPAISIRNELGGNRELWISLVSLNGKADIDPFILYVKGEQVDDVHDFYSIIPATSWTGIEDKGLWDGSTLYFDLPLGEQGESNVINGVIEFVCRDNYHRCRNLVVETDDEGYIKSSTASDYYMWRNRE